MKILSMTATFGKLSHQTLTLEPGMNIIHAPNEWGKSTWCAFITAMLYGIDTRQQTTKSALADKERFAPWSGEPMSGRMEIDWNGRLITIERSSKGRVPFGEFRAYETETGLEVPELTAANCGQQLLGVERSVFTRAGFIRLTDMPVTQDDSLRRRLNNLVTTGDESGAGDKLGKQLRELKNKVRYNRSGLLPQAEAQKDQLRSQLEQKQLLQEQSVQLQIHQRELEQQIRLLENHADALRYQAAKQGVERIAKAEENCQRICQELEQQEAVCADLIPAEEAAQKRDAGVLLQTRQRSLYAAHQQLPSPPAEPEPPAAYRDITPEQAITAAKGDLNQYRLLEKKKKSQGLLPVLFGSLSVLLAISALILRFLLSVVSPLLYLAMTGLILLLAAAAFVLPLVKGAKLRSQMEQISAKHPGIPAEKWVEDAESYQQSLMKYQLALEQYHLQCGQSAADLASLNQDIAAYAAEETLEAAIAGWEQVLQQYSLLEVKRRELKNAREHLSALQSVATTAAEPAFADELTLSSAETEYQLQEQRMELRNLQLRLGECKGQAATLESEQVLKEKLDTVTRRISRLEEYNKALELAQDVLYQATSALQRRFAPRISKQAQAYFSHLTDGRYDRITISDDLSLHASATGEDTLRTAAWRSDGTVDQLYLSLRLAVAGQITPHAPLVLDDALLRFDDARLAAAMEVLKEEAENKQVILFTCHNREQ